MSRILIVAPVGSDMHLAMEERQARAVLDPGTELTVRHIDGVPESIYVSPEEVFLPRLVEAVVRGERDGFDAIGISCCSDPGLAECRAAVSVPVCAPFDAVTSRASELGPLGILYLDVEPAEGESEARGDEWIPELLTYYDREGAVVAALPVHARRPEVDPSRASDPQAIGEAVVASMTRAMDTIGIAQARLVEAAGASAIFPTCTYWSGTLDRVREAVSVPVLDPIAELALCLERHADGARPPVTATTPSGRRLTGA